MATARFHFILSPCPSNRRDRGVAAVRSPPAPGRASSRPRRRRRRSRSPSRWSRTSPNGTSSPAASRRPTAVEVRARVSGYLQKVNFDDGAMVKKGDVLFVIDPRPYQAAVDQAKARPRRGASARLDWATSQLERAQALEDSPSMSPATLDERLQERRAAEAAVQQATAALQAAQLNLDFTKVTRADRRPRLQPPHRRRQPRHRRPERDAADDDRVARSDLLRLRHERGGLSRLSARRRARRSALDARPRDGRRGAPARRDGLAATRAR